MKKIILTVSLFLACFCLFAQNYREARIFVPPVSGDGEIGDNVFFFKQLTYEVVIQYHPLVRTQSASDFVLRGTIQRYMGEEQLKGSNYFNQAVGASYSGPVPPRPIPRIRNTMGRREFFSWETNGEITFYDSTGEEEYASGPGIVPALAQVRQRERVSFEYQEYVFFLELTDSVTGAALAKQHLIYRDVDDDVGTLVSVIVYNMLAGIPDLEEDKDWRDSWLFADISAMWAPMVYPSRQQSINWVNFGLGLAAEYQLLDFLALGFGLQLIVQNVIVDAAENGKEYRDFILQTPLSIRYVFKPLEHFMLEPYLGTSYNTPLAGVTKPSGLSWFAGFQFGVKAGTGMIVIDPRFSMDLSTSEIMESPSIKYQRYLIQISAGYKFGFFPKNPRARQDN